MSDSDISARRFETLGQLSSGIAHEINTPIHYIGSNLEFLSHAFNDLFTLLEFARVKMHDTSSPEIAHEWRELEKNKDLPYLLTEVPSAIQQAIQGIERVTELVKAMKAFAHPGNDQMEDVSLNEIVTTTASVSRNEWKYVAHLELELDPSNPTVYGNRGEFHQVLLNLIINAAHSIEERERTRGQQGTITIKTGHCTVYSKTRVWCEVHDTGTGIPEAIRHKIFEPYFTTKPAGKGTGQGLTFVRSIIEDTLKGCITVSTNIGKGTCFRVEVPTRTGS